MDSHISKSFVKETERLILSIIQLKDLQDVFETMNSQNTAETITFLQWPMTLSQAENWCKKSEKGLKTQTEFLFLARDRVDGSPIGCICLLKTKEPNAIEVGYWISESKQRKGFASELLKAMKEIAFELLGADKLIATAAIGNPASLRVLEKQGFKIIGKKELPTVKGTPLLCHLLEVHKLKN